MDRKIVEHLSGYRAIWPDGAQSTTFETSEDAAQAAKPKAVKPEPEAAADGQAVKPAKPKAVKPEPEAAADGQVATPAA